MSGMSLTHGPRPPHMLRPEQGLERARGHPGGGGGNLGFHIKRWENMEGDGVGEEGDISWTGNAPG